MLDKHWVVKQALNVTKPDKAGYYPTSRVERHPKAVQDRVQHKQANQGNGWQNKGPAIDIVKAMKALTLFLFLGLDELWRFYMTSHRDTTKVSAVTETFYS